jgi:hypothetical protein
VSFIPLLNIWAGYAIGRALERFTPIGQTAPANGSARGGRGRSWLVVIFFVVFGGTAAWYAAEGIESMDYPREYKRAGLWLSRTGETDIVVSARKPQISFYAGSRFVPLPHVAPEAVPAWMHHRGVTHLFLDERMIPRTHPELFPILSGETVPPSLVPLHRECENGKEALIYGIAPINRPRDILRER